MLLRGVTFRPTKHSAGLRPSLEYREKERVAENRSIHAMKA